MKNKKKLFILILILVLLLPYIQLPDTNIHASDWEECTYCGKMRSPDQLCDSCGGCGVDTMSDCFLEHHCPCGNCELDIPICPDCRQCLDCVSGDVMCMNCGLCEDCGGRICPECQYCVECVGLDLYCVDCGKCANCVADTGGYCFECELCGECTNLCSSGDCSFCEECAGPLCEGCGKCSMCTYGFLCESCGNCADCSGPICTSCLSCNDCATVCKGCEASCSNCETVCLGCERCEDCIGMPICEMCEECTDCSGATQCLSCNLCSNCVTVCVDCGEICEECADLCEECNRCENCVDLCNDCGLYCLECKDYCYDCEACEECVNLCDGCREMCDGCAEFCMDCNQCENCVNICDDCGEVCDECADFCSICNKCENCVDLCHDCGETCDECAEFCKECNRCENCVNIPDDSGGICDECASFYADPDESFEYEVIKPATETEEGQGELKSSVTGLVRKMIIPPTGKEKHVHDYSLWVYNPTHHEKYCLCGESDPLSKGEHELKWESNNVSHWGVCECGYVGARSPHTMGEWKVTLEATKNKPGSKERECSVCGYKEIQVIPSTAKDFIIKFDSNGGSLVENQTVLNGEKAIKPKKPSKKGYVFEGWYVDASGTKAWDFRDLIYESRTLYAKWKKGDKLEASDKEFIFKDVSENDWYYESVIKINKRGLMLGTDAENFSPKKNTSRSMIVTILYRLEKSPKVKENKFTDVQPGSWYADPVSWAADKGIVKGYGNGKFGPNDDITREQFITILYNYASYKGHNTLNKAKLEKYADYGQISNWAKDAMAWGVGIGVITGKTGTTLNSKDTASRAEVATMLIRFLEK